MIWSYLKTVFWVFFIVVILAVAIEFTYYLIPKVFTVILGLGILWAVYWAIRASWEEHKYYMEHQKPYDDARAKLRKVAIKAAWNDLKEIWAALKQAWAEFRSKETTP